MRGGTIGREQLRAWLDSKLDVARFRDYCPNGLQVEGRADVRRVVCGVTASQALIDAVPDWHALTGDPRELTARSCSHAIETRWRTPHAGKCKLPHATKRSAAHPNEQAKGEKSPANNVTMGATRYPGAKCRKPLPQECFQHRIDPAPLLLLLEQPQHPAPRRWKPRWKARDPKPNGRNPLMQPAPCEMQRRRSKQAQR